MATLATIRAQVRARIAETDPSNSHFSGTTALDTHINEGLRYLGSIIQYPRAVTTIQAALNTAGYSISANSNQLLTILDVYFGDPSVQGDVIPMKFLRPETMKVLNPSWLETNNSGNGRPRQCFLKDRDTLYVDPKPDAANSAANKLFHVYYSHAPTTLSADSDQPDLPFAYHDLIQYYAAHLAYLDIKNPEMSDKMFAYFEKKRKELESVVVRESEQNLEWQWADFSDDMPPYPGVMFR